MVWRSNKAPGGVEKEIAAVAKKLCLFQPSIAPTQHSALLTLTKELCSHSINPKDCIISLVGQH